MTARGSFWQGYWKSLKPLEVEEPIDVWVHRPLAYLLARAAFPTPISPNLITLCSIFWGIAAGVAIWGGSDYRFHLQIAGLFIFLSAIFDCADGQLARMRKTSSPLGRMLDGCADLVVSTVIVTGSAYLVWLKHREPTWLGIIMLTLAVITSVTGSFHTAMYDHFKNVFLRMTSPDYKEGEDYETALERYRTRAGEMSLVARFAWPIYFFYMRSQTSYVRGFDPNLPPRLSELPAYSPEVAAIYRKYAGGVMRLWRTFFGFGSLVFGLAVAIALEIPDYYLLFRLLVLNGMFYGYMRPAQRRATAQSLAEIRALSLNPAA